MTDEKDKVEGGGPAHATSRGTWVSGAAAHGCARGWRSLRARERGAGARTEDGVAHEEELVRGCCPHTVRRHVVGVVHLVKLVRQLILPLLEVVLVESLACEAARARAAESAVVTARGGGGARRRWSGSLTAWGGGGARLGGGRAAGRPGPGTRARRACSIFRAFFVPSRFRRT